MTTRAARMGNLQRFDEKNMNEQEPKRLQRKYIVFVYTAVYRSLSEKSRFLLSIRQCSMVIRYIERFTCYVLDEHI